MKDRRFAFLVGIFLLGLAIVVLVGGALYQRSLYLELHQRVSQEAKSVSNYFNNQLQRYNHIPELLTSHYQIRNAFLNDNSIQDLSLLLLDIAKTSGASDVYILNQDGGVVAASNFQTEASFIGGNYAFRPYFQEAMKGLTSTYYALGLRSGERGIFFSAPIYVDGVIAGVAAVKVDVDLFEQDTEWLAGNQSAKFMVYGEDKVVFMSNHPYWRLKQLQESGLISWSKIQASQRYLNLKQQILDNQKNSYWLADIDHWQMERSQGAKGNYVFGYSTLPLLGLEFVMLAPLEASLYQQTSFVLWLTIIYSALFIAAAYLYRRMAGYRQLIFTQNALEQEVKVRTAELETVHAALVKSAKLATIGQMSASINHEINQPLSAMNAYLVSCRRLIDKEQFTQARETLQTIESMVERVHKIVSQLKQFSRSSDNQFVWCDWTACLNSALVVLSPKLNSHHVSLEVQSYSGVVWGEALRLEQVIVNLLSNAIDAVHQSDVKVIKVEVEPHVDAVDIHIIDSGSGLELHLIDNIFEPFFTTKSEHGLGLGLSISRNIIRSFDGELSAANHQAASGAQFTIHLKSQPNGHKNNE
ncbi:ATP-binding protein [Vibrio hepatarius]|uniref:ATP-binding protein n=1 Tax=Vibrio hepatarius TaxID=171383 RepID=UPI0037365142